MAIDTEPCLSFGEDLSALLDAELEAGREAELRAHLATCDTCRAHLASLASVNDGLRAQVVAWEVERPDPELASHREHLDDVERLSDAYRLQAGADRLIVCQVLEIRHDGPGEAADVPWRR